MAACAGQPLRTALHSEQVKVKMDHTTGKPWLPVMTSASTTYLLTRI